MKKIISMLCLLVLFTGCTQKEKESEKEIVKDISSQEIEQDNGKEKTSQESVKDKEDVNRKYQPVIKLIEVNSENPEVIFEANPKEYLKFDTIFKSKTEKTFTTGEHWKFYYRINSTYKWDEITPFDYSVNDIGYLFNKKDLMTLELDMGAPFGNRNLPSGEYKVENTVFFDNIKDEKAVDLIFELDYE